jgi:hypothetical protein
VRIGRLELSTNLLLAPIAGYCDLSFRLAVRSIRGLGLAWTGLLSPHGLLRRTGCSMQLADTCAEDQPPCMQVYGNKPDLVARGARWARQKNAPRLLRTHVRVRGMQFHRACLAQWHQGCFCYDGRSRFRFSLAVVSSGMMSSSFSRCSIAAGMSPNWAHTIASRSWVRAISKSLCCIRRMTSRS